MINAKVEQIMCVMNTIEYGYKDKSGNNIITASPQKWNSEFSQFYKLLTPEKLLQTKYGVCWDQVELERKLFEENNIKFKTYFIYISDKDMLPSHTFLTYEDNNSYYWFEHSWGTYRGVHKYQNELDLLLDVKNIFRKEHSYVDKNAHLFLYEYQKPNFHISCSEFYKYIETQKLIEL